MLVRLALRMTTTATDLSIMQPDLSNYPTMLVSNNHIETFFLVCIIAFPDFTRL